MYKVSELSEMFKVSQVTIYNKLKLKELEPYVCKDKRTTYVTEEGYKVIKEVLNFKEIVEEPLAGENEVASDEIKVNEEIKEDYINFLKNEIEFKNKQIEELLLRLEQTTKLIENSQVLLKEKVQDPLQLEEHFQELDKKLIDMKEKLEARQEAKEVKKGFWKKLIRS